MTSTNDLRPALRQMWASVADHWAEHADEVDTARAPVTVALLERADRSRGTGSSSWRADPAEWAWPRRSGSRPAARS